MAASPISLQGSGSRDEERNALLERIHRLTQHLSGFLYQYRLRADGTSHFPYATEAMEQVYGCKPADVADDASPVFRVLHPDDLARVGQGIAESAQHLTVWRDQYRVNHPVRGLIWVAGHATPERADDGSVTWHGYLEDVTEKKLQADRLQLAAKVFSVSQEGILIADADNRIVDVNEAFVHITGYSREEVLGKSPAVLSSGRQGADFYRQMWHEIRTHGRWRGEIWNRNKSGELYAELLSIDSVRDSNGVLQNYIGVFTDISQLKKHQSELYRIAHYDILTGLPNRRVLDDRLNVAIEKAKRHGGLVAVCFLDLDGFKSVNDAFGHEAGDQLLVDLAGDIRHALRGHDTVARVGGDEFILLLTELQERSQIVEVVERVLEVANRRIRHDSQEVRVSASIGIAVYPDFELSSDELLRYADQAMYRAKQQGRNRYIFFDSREDQASRALHDKLAELEHALDAGEFRLFFQPKVDLRTGHVFSAEALIRRELPNGEIQSPGLFMETVLGHPLEVRIGRWVLEAALQHHRDWARAGHVLPVSINVSADHLLHPGFVRELADSLARHQIADPSLIEIEILETSRFADFGRVRDRLMECKLLGVRFSLDDFGTGYSSLTYMRQLPVDVLKIDQSFVRDMLNDQEDFSIVQGIIGLAHAFGHQVVAEGAETRAHLALLRGLGCDAAQGYGIARPMPAGEMPGWMAAWNHVSAAEWARMMTPVSAAALT